MKRVVGYVRVSTVAQDVERQKKLIRDYVANNGYVLIRSIEVDKVSGAKKYEYITATDSGFTNVLSSGTTSSVSATVSGLRNVSTVYVKVRTVTNDGTSDWTVKTFTK
jgi:hypothetical protein